jgi:hypothetical protein
MKRLLVALSLSGCVHYLPPPPVPEPVMPAGWLPLGLPTTGSGRVFLDATNGPAEVKERKGRTDLRLVCWATPCVAELPFGHHALEFTSLSDSDVNGTGTVEVNGPTVAYRFTMGRTQHWKDLFKVPGVLSLILSAGLLFIAAEPKDAAAELRLGVLGVGALTIGLGVVLLLLGNEERQDGRGMQWTPWPCADFGDRSADCD